MPVSGFSKWNFVFWTCTPKAYSPQWPGHLNTVCFYLTFEEDDDSSIDSTHSMLEQNTTHLQNTNWLTTSPVPKKKMKKKNKSQQLHVMMMLGWKNQFQTGTYTYMIIPNHMTCALTLAHTAWISYTSLQNTHQHLSTWTSVMSLTSQCDNNHQWQWYT